MSFVVATKGPVAIAGSILSLFKITGTIAPTIVAFTIIINKEAESMYAKFKSTLKNKICQK